VDQSRLQNKAFWFNGIAQLGWFRNPKMERGMINDDAAGSKFSEELASVILVNRPLLDYK